MKRINPPDKEQAKENMVKRMEETNAGLREENRARQAKLAEHSKKEETVAQSLVENIEEPGVQECQRQMDAMTLDKMDEEKSEVSPNALAGEVELTLNEPTAELAGP